MRNTICATLTAITLTLCTALAGCEIAVNALLRWVAEHDKEKEQQ